MVRHILQYKTKISRNEAIKKINDYGLYGEHSFDPRPKTDSEVANLFISNGFDFKRLAEECRDYKRPIPLLENLLGPTSFFSTSGGGKVKVIDEITGDVTVQVGGHGVISVSTYQSLFETACENRDRAVENASYADFLVAVTQGIASIERFIASLARKWSNDHFDDQLIDSKESKVSLDDKIDVWLPKITSGNKVNKGIESWSKFVELRRIRDNENIHVKHDVHGITYAEVAKRINFFRMGIAGMLGHLHLVSGKAIPAMIINAINMPEVQVVNEEK